MEIPYSSGEILYTLRSASNFASVPKKQQHYPHTLLSCSLFNLCRVNSSFEVLFFILILIYS